MSTSRRELAFRVATVPLVILCCVYVARSVDIGAALHVLAGAPLWLVAVCGVVNIFETWLRAVAFSVLLSPRAKVPLGRLFRYTLVGVAASNLLPWRLGDLVPISLIRSREGVPTPTVIAVTLVEKCAEGVVLVLVAAPLPLLIPSLPQWISIGLLLMGGVGAALLGLAWLASRETASRWPILARFAEGARVVRDPRLFTSALILALGALLVDAATVWLLLRAVGVEVSLAAPILLELAMMTIGVMPSTVGTFEMSAVLALRVFGVDEERALAFALLYRAMDVLPITGLGILLVPSVGGIAVLGLRRRDPEPLPPDRSPT